MIQYYGHPSEKLLGRQFHIEEIEELGDDLIIKVRHGIIYTKGILWWKKKNEHSYLSTYRGRDTVWYSYPDGLRCDTMEPYLCAIATRYKWEK